jgi:uncharacterized membrane protein
MTILDIVPILAIISNFLVIITCWWLRHKLYKKDLLIDTLITIINNNNETRNKT